LKSRRCTGTLRAFDSIVIKLVKVIKVELRICLPAPLLTTNTLWLIPSRFLEHLACSFAVLVLVDRIGIHAVVEAALVEAGLRGGKKGILAGRILGHLELVELLVHIALVLGLGLLEGRRHELTHEGVRALRS
jgi:hypothetical protein